VPGLLVRLLPEDFSLAAMTHIAVKRPSMRGNQMTETVSDMKIGDQGETLVPMNLRAEIDFRSEIIGSLPEQVLFTVVETGANHRALISSGNATGWISTKTDLDQPLCRRVQEGSGALPVFQALVQLNMRRDMEFKSDVETVVPIREEFDLIEAGPQNRVKILYDGVIGWVSAKTDLGQPLISELTAEKVTKMTKNLDSFLVRALSQAQVTKVLSSRSLGQGAERSMSRGKSMGQETSATQAKAAGAQPKAPPQLSKLACCCG